MLLVCLRGPLPAPPPPTHLYFFYATEPSSLETCHSFLLSLRPSPLPLWSCLRLGLLHPTKLPPWSWCSALNCLLLTYPTLVAPPSLASLDGQTLMWTSVGASLGPTLLSPVSVHTLSLVMSAQLHAHDPYRHPSSPDLTLKLWTCLSNLLCTKMAALSQPNMPKLPLVPWAFSAL